MNLFQFSKCCDKKITSPVSSKLPKLMSIHIKIQHIQSPTHRFLCKSTTAWDGLMEIITHPVNWLSCSTIDSTLSSSLFTVVLGEDSCVSCGFFWSSLSKDFSLHVYGFLLCAYRYGITWYVLWRLEGSCASYHEQWGPLLEVTDEGSRLEVKPFSVLVHVERIGDPSTAIA